MSRRRCPFWLPAAVLLAMAGAGARGAEGGAALEDFRNARSLREVRDCRVEEGRVSPTGRAALTPDADDDLRVLLRCEERSTVNLIYTRYAEATANAAAALDRGILIDDGKIESVEGRQGRGFHLRGGRIRVPLPHLYFEDYRRRGFSYSLWIKPDALDQNLILASSTAAQSQLAIRDGKLVFSHRAEDGSRPEAVGTTPIAPGAWRHVAAVYDPFGKEARVYVDGNLDGATANWKPLAAGEMYVSETFGGLANTDRQAFHGAVDDVVVATRPFGDAQVRALLDGRCASGSFESQPRDLGGEFNTLTLSVDESAPGASQVYVWQNDRWHRIYSGVPLICDMPARMPLSSLRYKVVFAGATELRSLKFEWENRDYAPAKNKFSFLVVGDSHLGPTPQMIEWAYGQYPDLALVAGTGDVADVSDFHAAYKQSWTENPGAHPGLLPWFFAPGNHDIEYPRFVDYLVRRLGPAAPLSLPGMRNFREGPFDTYPEHGGYEDRFLQYSFDYRNAHFVILNVYYRDVLLPDSPDGKVTRNRMAGHDGKPKAYAPMGSVSADMLAWLDEDLGATKAKFKFLFFHEGAHPVPGGRHNGDSLDAADYPGNRGPDDTRPMRDKFWSLLAAHGVTATFVGHNHHAAQTWAADPAGKAPAVYEFEAGGAMSPRHGIVVSIDENVATVRHYATSENRWDFKEKWAPVVFNKNSDAPNDPVKLMHFDASREDYRPTDQRAYRLEVGTQMRGARALYFEGRDNNLDDRIAFTFENLPSFLKVDDRSATFRRAIISSSKLTPEDLGDHSFAVTVSDGKTADRMEIGLSVLPAEKPEILGAVTPNGAVLASWQVPEVAFFCRDNVELDLYLEYPVVKIDGRVLEGSGAPFGDRSQGWWRSYLYAEGTKSVSFNGPVRVPGDYEITMVCHDQAGNRSDPYTLRFKVVDDGKRPEEGVPYVLGCWPRDGATVGSLPDVRVWFASPVGDTARLFENTEIVLTRDGRPVEEVARTKLARGVAISLPADAPAGNYALTVVPKTIRAGQTVTGKEFTARITLKR